MPRTAMTPEETIANLRVRAINAEGLATATRADYEALKEKFEGAEERIRDLEGDKVSLRAKVDHLKIMLGGAKVEAARLQGYIDRVNDDDVVDDAEMIQQPTVVNVRPERYGAPRAGSLAGGTLGNGVVAAGPTGWREKTWHDDHWSAW